MPQWMPLLPPFGVPWLRRLRHSTLPRASGSSANISPDFCPTSSVSRPAGEVLSTTEAPMSQSGPGFSGQLGPSSWQAPFHTSSASAWNCQRGVPSSMPSAITASLVAVAGCEKFWPVPT